MNDHEHREYATTRDLNGVGGKVESMRERVAVNTERSKTNKQEITQLFDLHRDTEKQVGQVAQTCTHEIGKVSGSVIKIRTQLGIAVGIVIVVLEVAAKLLDRFFPAGTP